MGRVALSDVWVRGGVQDVGNRRAGGRALVTAGRGMIRGDGFNDREDAAAAILGHEEAGSATTEEAAEGCAV